MPMSEAEVQAARRAAHANKGILWRNNVGSLRDNRGSWVRFGLANDSKRMNKHIKSADLIGITRVLVTPEMVGTVVGIFTSEEIKHESWIYGGTEHELAQLKWRDIVISHGGIASFQNKVI